MFIDGGVVGRHLTKGPLDGEYRSCPTCLGHKNASTRTKAENVAAI